MTFYRFHGYTPKIGSGVFVADSADIIGQVELGDNSNIWFGCVLRGDLNKIVVGANSNIQDLSMMHVVEKIPAIVGSGVSVGHKVTIHACEVKNNCLIGMGSTILDGAVIGENSLVAAGSVVPPGKIYPPNSFIIGTPAVVKRQLTEKEVSLYGQHYLSYLKLKDEFLKKDNLTIIEI